MADQNRKTRKFKGTFVGSGVIPIMPGLARQIVPEGMDLSRFNAGTHPILLDHRAEYSGQVGRIIKAEATPSGIEGEFEIFSDAPEEVHQRLDNKMWNLSIGFKPLRNEYVDTDLGTIIRTTESEGDEVSLVAIGASKAARIVEEL